MNEKMAYRTKYKDKNSKIWGIKAPFLKKGFIAFAQQSSASWPLTKGVCSRCSDGNHVIFFDFDFFPLEKIESEIKAIQKSFRLSNAYIFKLGRENSFHAIILDKLSMAKAKKIISAAGVEKSFVNAPAINYLTNSWILRTGKKGSRRKPVFLKMILSGFNENEVSTAHKLFLESYYAAPHFEYKKEDLETELTMVVYGAGTHRTKPGNL